MRPLLRNLHFRLVAACLVGGLFLGAYVLATGEKHAWRHPWIAAVGAGLLLAGVMAGAIRFSWHRKGGWVDREQVRDWVRNERLPDDVPLGEAMSRLSSRVDQIRMTLWSNSGLLVLMIAQLAFQAGVGDLPGTALRVAVGVLFASALAWSIYARVRLVPVMNDLILEGKRRFAGAPEPTA
jgi:hypothetical protein